MHVQRKTAKVLLQAVHHRTHEIYLWHEKGKGKGKGKWAVAVRHMHPQMRHSREANPTPKRQ